MMLTKIKSLSNTWHFYAILVALIGLSLISLWYTNCFNNILNLFISN